MRTKIRSNSRFHSEQIRAVLLLGSVFGSGWVSPALAQTIPSNAPPVRITADDNGVDLSSGQIAAGDHVVSIGAPSSGSGPSNGVPDETIKASGHGGLIFHRSFVPQAGWSDSTDIMLTPPDQNNKMAIIFPSATQTFTLSGGIFVSDAADGSSVVQNSSTSFTYTAADGTRIDFQQVATTFMATAITFPSGQKQTFTFKSATGYYNFLGNIISFPISRLQSVNSSDGYQLKLSYASNVSSDVNSTIQWITRTSVSAINGATDYCDPQADSCGGLSQAWPSLGIATSTSGGNTIAAITDPDGRTTTYTVNSSQQLTGIRRPSSSSDDVTISYGGLYVSSITDTGVTTNYSYGTPAAPNYYTQITISNSGNTIRTTQSDILKHMVITDTDGLGHTTTYTPDGYGRLTQITYPEGNNVQYSYDARGNVAQTTFVPKSGSGLSNLTFYAGFDATCGNSVKCNQPNWTKDALGNQTDYTYDNTHGGVLTVTRPAPSSGAPRPQVRYSYTPLQAYYKNSSGSIVASGQSVYMITGISTCLNSGSCAGAAEEQKTTLGYGTFANGTPNNLLVQSKSVAAGDSSVITTTAMSYDNIGNLASVDGPLSGSGDTTTYKYDANRRPVGAINPLPNGSSLYPARRFVYDGYGYKYLDEVGTVTSQSDAAWANFSVVYLQYSLNNAAGRPVRTTLSSNNIDYSVRDFLYDARGRLTCTIDYMNPATWGGYASSCTPLQTGGSFGPDRVTQTTYDIASRVTQVSHGVGTVNVVSEVTAYTASDKVDHVVDGQGNRTTYTYDGFNRLVATNFPVGTQGANSSSGFDYEQLTYGDNVNVTARRLRDGNSITLTYDNLNRLASRTPTGENTVYYSYNLLDMPTQAYRPGDGVNVTFSYDALGRKLSDVQPFGSVGYQYNTAGNLVRLTWGDGFYVNYDRDNAGNVTAIRENGASSGVGVLAAYTYDSLNRRSSVTFGNGTGRSYDYDAIGRLKGLSIDLAGTANDLLIGQVSGNGTAIGYNPVSQITSITRSNSTYSFADTYNVNRSYTANGLNQYSVSGSVSLGYDARGNLTTSGASSFAYNKLDLLVSAPGGISLNYDSLDRLAEYDASTSTRNYYSGSNMVAEVTNPSGTILRRFVPGPGTDERIVWYEGSGTSDRRFLQADERGSIVAITDSSGSLIGINRYDEYGIPASANIGRFQYTGQAWYPELGMYNYKARIYSPTLGRFMQTDPSGYQNGLNWYNYAMADPINSTDPSGLGTLASDGSIVVSCCSGQVTPDRWDQIEIIGSLAITMTADNFGKLLNSLTGNTPVIKPQSGNRNPICSTRLRNGSTIGKNAAAMRAMLQAEIDAVAAGADPTSLGSATKGAWFARVAPGGIWAGGLGEPWGNYNYGATGRAAGIPLSVLLRGAGAAEQLEGLTGRTGSESTGQGNPFGGPPYGDNPEGQEQIKQGYNAGC